MNIILPLKIHVVKGSVRKPIFLKLPLSLLPSLYLSLSPSTSLLVLE
jgi:hypothetical protein